MCRCVRNCFAVPKWNLSSDSYRTIWSRVMSESMVCELKLRFFWAFLASWSAWNMDHNHIAACLLVESSESLRLSYSRKIKKYILKRE